LGSLVGSPPSNLQGPPAVIEQRDHTLARLFVDVAFGKQVANFSYRLRLAEPPGTRPQLIQPTGGADALPLSHPRPAADASFLSRMERMLLPGPFRAGQEAEKGGDDHPDTVADQRDDDQDEQQE
jgi:hypothetical protein